jgi:16S rRNA (guanine527-N7)-methyltransferase
MPGADAAALQAAAATLGMVVSDDATGRILRYLGLLDVWNQRFHLTGDRDPATLLRKHAVDSLAPSIMLPASGVVVDIGTGAGFPGIILACVRPDLDTVLVEPRRRPSSFLREAVRSIPLPRARVIEARAEDTVGELGGTADAVTSRALRLEVFLSLASPILAHGGSAIAMQTPREEGHEARKFGLQVAQRLDYTLPDGGEPRRLLRFVRLDRHPFPG